MKIAIIGDVHGNTLWYQSIVANVDYSIQLGDFGFCGDYRVLDNVNPTRHRILGGNHDDYTMSVSPPHKRFVNQTPHFLGDYGVSAMPVIGSYFFVRGGRSIDMSKRINQFNWWPEEQLNAIQMADALAYYIDAKPRCVFSHECPAEVIEQIPDVRDRKYHGNTIEPSTTARLLQEMLEQHQPDMWVFGHHHTTWRWVYAGTNFICVNKESAVITDTSLLES